MAPGHNDGQKRNTPDMGSPLLGLREVARVTEPMLEKLTDASCGAPIKAAPHAKSRGRLLKPGKEVRLEEIYEEDHLKLIKALARDNFRTMRYIADLLFISIDSVRDLVYQINEIFSIARRRIRTKCETPIRKSETHPHLFFIEQQFAAEFGLAVAQKFPSLSKGFTRKDREFFDALSLSNCLTSQQTAQRLGMRPVNIPPFVKRINRRCSEFGMPDAVVVGTNAAGKQIYSLDSFFASLHAIEEAPRIELATFFTRRQQQVIKWLVKNPFSKTREIADALDLRQAAVREAMRFIDERCLILEAEYGNNGNTHFLIEVGGNHGRFAMSEDFCDAFALECQQPDPMRIIRGRKHRIAYIHLTKHPERSWAQISEETGISTNDLQHYRRTISRMLVAAGLDPLPGYKPPKRVVSDELRGFLIKIRCNKGEWSETLFWKRSERLTDDLAKEVRGYLTGGELIAAVKESLDEVQITRIRQCDSISLARTVDFEKFGERGPELKEAALEALQASAKRANVSSILNDAEDADQAIELLKAIAIASTAKPEPKPKGKTEGEGEAKELKDYPEIDPGDDYGPNSDDYCPEEFQG